MPGGDAAMGLGALGLGGLGDIGGLLGGQTDGTRNEGQGLCRDCDFAQRS